MKIVVNKCFGGFNLSEEAVDMLVKMRAIWEREDYRDLERNDEDLVTVVEVLGSEANGFVSKLQIVEIPDSSTDWELNNYDGFESIIYVVEGKLHHA